MVLSLLFKTLDDRLTLAPLLRYIGALILVVAALLLSTGGGPTSFRAGALLLSYLPPVLGALLIAWLAQQVRRLEAQLVGERTGRTRAERALRESAGRAENAAAALGETGKMKNVCPAPTSSSGVDDVRAGQTSWSIRPIGYVSHVFSPHTHLGPISSISTLSFHDVNPPTLSLWRIFGASPRFSCISPLSYCVLFLSKRDVQKIRRRYVDDTSEIRRRCVLKRVMTQKRCLRKRYVD